MAITSKAINFERSSSGMRKCMEDESNSKPNVTLELQAFERFSRRKQTHTANSPKSASSIILSEAAFSDESMMAATPSFGNSSCFHGHHSELSLSTVTPMQPSDHQLRLFTSARSWQEHSTSANFVDSMRVNVESELNFHHPHATTLGSLFGSHDLLTGDSTPGLFCYSIEAVQSQDDDREKGLDAAMLDLTSKLGSTDQNVAENASVLRESARDFSMYDHIPDDSHAALSLRSHGCPSGLDTHDYMKPAFSEPFYFIPDSHLSNEDIQPPLTLQYASNLRPSMLHAPLPEVYFLNSNSNGSSFDQLLRNHVVSGDCSDHDLQAPANCSDHSYYATSNLGLHWNHEESMSHLPLSFQNDWHNMNETVANKHLALLDFRQEKSLKRSIPMDPMAQTSSENKRIHVEGGALKRSIFMTSLNDCEGGRMNETKAVSFKASSSGKKPSGPALNTNLKPRARQGSANDPQSIAARHRRERISQRLKILQNLIPNGSKVDLVTMLEKAITYVKFLQLQVRVLTTDEYWPNQDSKEKQTNQKDAAEVTSKVATSDDAYESAPDQSAEDQLNSTPTHDSGCQPSSSQSHIQAVHES